MRATLGTAPVSATASTPPAPPLRSVEKNTSGLPRKATGEASGSLQRSRTTPSTVSASGDLLRPSANQPTRGHPRRSSAAPSRCISRPRGASPDGSRPSSNLRADVPPPAVITVTLGALDQKAVQPVPLRDRDRSAAVSAAHRTTGIGRRDSLGDWISSWHDEESVQRRRRLK